MSRPGRSCLIGDAGRAAGRLRITPVMLLAFTAWSLALVIMDQAVAFGQETEPQPTADPLNVPEMPDNPSQVDVGRISYYYNCMPCHGDHGQGLTDEWRQTWVDDHQNCWARGCHSGRSGEEGFALPTTIPAVAGNSAALAHFPTAVALHDYLDETHPPQRPGALPADEYWALTAFLLSENDRLPAGAILGAEVDQTSPGPAVLLVLGVLVGSIAVLILFRSLR